MWWWRGWRKTARRAVAACPWLISVVLSGRGAADGGLPFILRPANLFGKFVQGREVVGSRSIASLRRGVDQVLTLDSCAVNLFFKYKRLIF